MVAFSFEGFGMVASEKQEFGSYYEELREGLSLFQCCSACYLMKQCKGLPFNDEFFSALLDEAS